MKTARCDSHVLRTLMWSGGILLLSVMAYPKQALSAPEDVTASVQDGTLKIKRASGSTDGFFGVSIALEGRLDEHISVFVGNDLLDTFPRSGISAINIDADQSFVSLGRFSFFEFEGDINVDVHSGGACELFLLNMRGDLHLRGSAGSIQVFYLRGTVDGNLTLQGGPGDDGLSDSSGFGDLAVSGDLSIDGGPGNEFVSLENVFVGGDTLIRLGQSSGGKPSSSDSDFCKFELSAFVGNVMIWGDEGNDVVSVVATDIGRNFLVDLGNGADRLTLLPVVTFGDDAIIFLDGGNGISDELSLFGFPLASDEHTGFETVNP